MIKLAGRFRPRSTELNRGNNNYLPLTNRKQSFQRVSEINLFSESSADAEQIIKVLCVWVLIRLFFVWWDKKNPTEYKDPEM